MFQEVWSPQRDTGAAAGHHKGHDALAFYFVRHSDNGCLRHSRVLAENIFHFGGSYFPPSHVHGLVRAPVQKPEAIFVHAGPIAVEPPAWESRPVGVDVAQGLAPDPRSDGRSRL